MAARFYEGMAALGRTMQSRFTVCKAVAVSLSAQAVTGVAALRRLPAKTAATVRAVPVMAKASLKSLYMPAPDEAAARRSGRRAGVLQLGAMLVFAATAVFIIAAPAVAPAAMALAVTVGSIGLPIAVAGFVLGAMQEERAGPMAWGGAFVAPEQRGFDPVRRPPPKPPAQGFAAAAPAAAAEPETAPAPAAAATPEQQPAPPAAAPAPEPAAESFKQASMPRPKNAVRRRQAKARAALDARKPK